MRAIGRLIARMATSNRGIEHRREKRSSFYQTHSYALLRILRPLRIIFENLKNRSTSSFCYPA